MTARISVPDLFLNRIVEVSGIASIGGHKPGLGFLPFLA
jgi:hypothetical protein